MADLARIRAEPAAPGRGGPVLDAAALLLVCLMGVWTLGASLGRPGSRPVPVVLLLVASVVAAVMGRRVGARQPSLVPGVVAVSTGGALVLGFPDLLRAGGGPTGYANSNASLAALGAIAAGAALASTDATKARPAWAALAFGLGAAVVATGSVAASIALGVAVLLAMSSVLTRQVALAVAGGLVAVSIVLGTTVAIAAGGDPLDLRHRDELRAELWERALEQARDDPLRGVGPGRYGEPTPVSRDADLRWAHHGYLQLAAEQGIVGLLLLLGLLGWAYGRLWQGRGRSHGRTLAGAAALTVVGIQTAVDHILHTPSVPIMLAALVGWSTADRRDPGTPD